MQRGQSGDDASPPPGIASRLRGKARHGRPAPVPARWRDGIAAGLRAMASPRWSPTGYDGQPLLVEREAAVLLGAVRAAFPENVRSIGMEIAEDECAGRLATALRALHRDYGLSVWLTRVPFVDEDAPAGNEAGEPVRVLDEPGDGSSFLVAVSYRRVPAGFEVPYRVAFADPTGEEREPDVETMRRVMVAMQDAGVPACVALAVDDRPTPADAAPSDRRELVLMREGPYDDASLAHVETGINFEYGEDGPEVVRRAHALGLTYREAASWGGDLGLDDAEIAAWREQHGRTPAWPLPSTDHGPGRVSYALPPELMRLHAARRIGLSRWGGTDLSISDADLEREGLDWPFVFSPVGTDAFNVVLCTAFGVERELASVHDEDDDEPSAPETSSPGSAAALLVGVGVGDVARRFFADLSRALRRSAHADAPATLAVVDGLLAALDVELARPTPLVPCKR